MNALLLAVFVAFLGPETSTPVHDPGDFALLRLRDGYVLAWSDGGRLYAERLDAEMRAATAPFSMPMVVPTSVSSLSLASNGANVLMVWNESRGTLGDASYAAILAPDVRSLLHGPQYLAIGTGQSAAAAREGKYRVMAASQLWTLDDTLGVESAEPLSNVTAAAFNASGDFGTASRKLTTQCNTSGFNPAMIVQTCSFDETVAFAAPAGMNSFDFQWQTTKIGAGPAPAVPEPVLLPPVIAPNGNGFFGILVTLTGTSLLDVRQNGRVWMAPQPPLTAAGNGSDIVLVYRDGVVIFHSDGTSSSPIPITAEVAKIVEVSSNQFVILYRSGTLLTARTLSLQAPRRRAVQ